MNATWMRPVAHVKGASIVAGTDACETSVSTVDSANWIEDDEKYSLVGLDVKTEGVIPGGELVPGLFVLTETAFHIPTHWQEWSGTIRADEVKNCNIFLVSKLPKRVDPSRRRYAVGPTRSQMT
jgi:hypothetical protein